ncbi:sulfatase-like hydrolase/transferase [Luteolibacter yonseiensis]|uniref:Sulfatase-like hydrolase/transferase n=1 Tax=Luteolibacter yonseiensis TaxID=1144680 RepID=A0A934R526_9BACT|nr:arylsulfatase [Luteolibacter yonseiensis]MBK1817107.1 sulfatase-like hydrolase/transferase [Luteolibacter yonseiensis]
MKGFVPSLIGFSSRLILPFFLTRAVLATENSPNIVFILADDLGYGDVSIYNPESKIRTPHLDRLAGQGMRFTDAHAPSSVCTPTRYSILTGRLAWRSPLKSGVLPPWGAPLIDAKRLTVSAFLKQNGYRTAAIGKWHLGWTWPTRDGQPPASGADRLSNVDFTKPVTGGPTDRGFDYYFGVDVPNYPPYVYIENDRTVGIPAEASGPAYNRPGPALPGWDWTNVLPEITRRGVTYIEEAGKKSGPYFLYVPLTSPHYPVVPTPEFRGKSGAGDYGDFVLQTDDAVGRILDAIDRSGQAENTLVIFTSDNGPEVTGEVKPGVYDRVKQYGHSSSGGLRGAKRDLWEGGHRVPFIARWPRRIKPALTSETTISHVDFFATAAAILGKPLDPEAAPDSFNILPALIGEPSGQVRPATIHHGQNGNLAIRQGDWVFINAPSGDGNREPSWRKEEWKIQPHDEQAELFNLKDDPRQTRNLYSGNRDKALELKSLLDRFISTGRSTPGPDLANDPASKDRSPSRSNATASGPWKSGDVLDAANAPKISGRGFTFNARITAEKNEGVIAAQGGARHGYALYLQDGKLVFALRTDAKLTTASAPAPPLHEATDIEATLENSGKLTLKIQGETAATGQAPAVIAQHPGDPLSIGSDARSPVGPYPSPNPFQGKIEQARIHLQNPE